MPASRDGDATDQPAGWKTAAVVAIAALALALALFSLYRTFGPRSQWGSQAPPMTGGGPMAPTPAPLPPAPGRR
jgi:hypothetical protein